MTKTLLAFDLYGTLLSPASIGIKLASHFGQEADSIATAWRKYQLEYTWRLNSMSESASVIVHLLSALISSQEQYQSFSEITRNSLVHALKEHSRDLDEPSIEKLMRAYDSLSIFPDVAPTLNKLSSRPDIECVVFSNGTKTMVSNSVTKSEGLSPYASVFRNLITVDFVRSFKPAPEVYKYLAQCVEKVGKEDEMWLVSGNPFDVVGARAVGMQAAWVDRAGNGWQDMLGGEPTVVVRSLEEVADAVASHAKVK